MPATAAPRQLTSVTDPAFLQASGPAAMSEAEVTHLVALHAAAAELSPRAGVRRREELRAVWAAALRIIWLEHDPDFALAYIPGVVARDSVSYAVHLPSGTVHESDASLSTSEWLSQLRRGLTAA